MRYLSLAAFLLAFWLVLSGHYTPMLITAGAVCSVLCVLAAIRMRVATGKAIRSHYCAARSPTFVG